MIGLNRVEIIGRLGADVHNSLVCPLTIMSTFKPNLRSVLRMLAATPIAIIVALGLSLSWGGVDIWGSKIWRLPMATAFPGSHIFQCLRRLIVATDPDLLVTYQSRQLLRRQAP